MTDLLSTYLTWVTANESPKIYHTWAGLSLISHITGRRVWTDMEMFKVYPEMYVFLVGEAGLTKSTAMLNAKSVIEDYFPNIPIAPASITKEAIAVMMADVDEKKPSGCTMSFQYKAKQYKFSQLSVFADEMITLLNAGGNLPGMIDFLTALWGAKEYRDKTKNKGDFPIHNPCLTILGCLTTETIQKLAQDKLLTSGMSRRCIFVLAFRNDKSVPIIRLTPEQKAAKSAMRDLCFRTQQYAGEFPGPAYWEPELQNFYENWYNENSARIERTSSDVLRHFLRSKPKYCIIVSMLLVLSSGSGVLEHTLASFVRATELVSEVENGAQILFDSHGRNELYQLADKVYRYLFMEKDCQAVHVKELQAYFWNDLRNGDVTEIDRVIEHLQRCGHVQLSAEGDMKFVRWLRKE